MTRRKQVVLATVAAVLVSAAPARAHVGHTVEPGETLWSIAAASNLTTRTVAAFNGIPETAHVVEGQTIWIPSIPEGVAALQKAGVTSAPAAPATTTAAATAPATTVPASTTASGGGYTVRPGDTLSGLAATAGVSAADLAAANGLTLEGPLIAGSTIKLPSASGTPVRTTVVASTPAAAPRPQGGYTVRPGDTLSGLAAVARVRPEDIAAMNGLSLEGPLVAGTVIKLPTGSPTPPAAQTTPAPATTVIPAAAPAPVPARVTASDVQSIAAAHGVPASLAAAIAWQESGFNNAMVSSANARGVMQVMPGTWDYVQHNLSQRRLDPTSAEDNVHAGVLYLKRLLQETGGDETAAAAAYYQGLGALRSRGMFEDTKRYVANVQALRARFGG